ncbi:E3 ubiquitin-protein ligase XIAP isoform X2 [Alosa alosa]|uniref:E3 ubiquitin-protein ligase XIAP isoform X2 n=1 Tax=Alosa alosa TaxID=278164 RepID=UPI0020153E5F|nr:E3 ubiquitin-protein ligase XIAP isoform X2 [Alosa alosa]
MCQIVVSLSVYKRWQIRQTLRIATWKPLQICRTMAGNDGELQTDEAMDWSTISARVNSFRHFPRAKEVSAERLARAGFYFTGESDRVRCFSCQQTVENWSSADTPVNRHLQASPACKFLSCVHRTGSFGIAPLSNGSVYDEAAEAMEFSLRTGEVVDESTYPMAPHMCAEDARIRSFGTSWPASAPVRSRRLAQAGLYYLGEADRVQCFCCGGMLAGWEPGDEPWSEHSRHFPNCFFILGHDVGNVPSAQPPESDGPRVHMESYEERLGSFAGRQHPVDHERLARAGFYSSGASDRVTCFRCGGGLKNWQPEEDPWEQHAKYYPGCSFLLSEKGHEFVNSIQLQNPSKSNPASSHHQNGFSKQEKASIMQSEIAQRAVEMGFDPVKVERAILEKIRRFGQGYSSVENLIQDVLSNSAENDPEGSHANDDENPLEKLEKLQREKQCKICMDSDACIVFVPCGHLATCKRCSDSLGKCPICCANIIQKIKTYIS